MTEPYYQDATVTVLAGDCLDVLRTLPDNSVDSVVTDPPYGLEFMGKEWDAFKPPSARIRTRLDGRTNGAEKSTVSTPEAYKAGRPFQQWCELWAAECLRVLKPGGHMLAFGGSRTFTAWLALSKTQASRSGIVWPGCTGRGSPSRGTSGRRSTLRLGRSAR